MTDTDLKQKQFDILYSTLGDLQTGLMSGTGQVAGFFLLVIGWLATSKDAQAFLEAHKTGRFIVAMALAGAYGLYAFGACQVYGKSQRTFRMLLNLNFMPSDFYQGRVLDLPELSIFIGGTSFLFILTIVLVLQPL